MLDAVVDYLPAPTDVAAIDGLKLDGETKDERHALMTSRLLLWHSRLLPTRS